MSAPDPGDGATKTPPAAPVKTAKRRRPKAPLWKRMLLALSSLLVTALLLESASRLLIPVPVPVQLRDGIYVHQLPLVNGHNTVPSTLGKPLPIEKRAGEKRIFVFGESSVEGGPWGYPASPVTMLYDQLRAKWPDQDLTVVNMGRGAATTMDAYYFLVTIERFAPDVVIFYQGGNDFFSTDRERCLPALHPWVHGAFRWLVEHSRLVWTLRATGPSFVARLAGPSASPSGGAAPTELCEDGKGFQAWADILVSTARRMGAQVIVTTPVQNPLRWAEATGRWGVESPLSLADKSDAYKRLLACVLTEDCDLPAIWARERDASHYTPLWMAARRDAWHSAAEGRASFLDFGAYLDENAAAGLRPPLFSDEVHLSFEGYWRLAWLWSREIEAVLHGQPPPGPAREEPPPLNLPRYLSAVTHRARRTGACILLGDADVYLRGDMPLMAASILRPAAAFEAQVPSEPARSRAGLTAQLLMGKLRRDLGMDPALPALLAPRLDGLDLAKMSADLHEHPDCSTVGGPELPAAPQEDLGDETTAYMIPGGQDALIGEMLGRALASPDGCSLERASIPGTHIEALFRCPDGQTAAVELHHPSTLLPALAMTDRFLIRQGDPPPSPALVQALVVAIRAKEGAFVWKRDGPPQSTPVVPGAQPGRAPVRWVPAALGIALATGILLLARARRRAAQGAKRAGGR